MSAEQEETIESLRAACSTRPPEAVLSAIQQSDREDEIFDWLEDHGLDSASGVALAETPVQIEDLDRLAETVSGEALEVTLRWIAAECTTRSLAADIERAASRISELVGAIKQFTHMDNLAGAP